MKEVLMWLIVTLGIIFLVSFVFLAIYILIDSIRDIGGKNNE